MKTREQWVEQVMDIVDIYSDCQMEATREKLRALLLEVPDCVDVTLKQKNAVRLFAEANTETAKYFAEKSYRDEILKLNSEIKGLREVNSILTDENEKLRNLPNGSP